MILRQTALTDKQIEAIRIDNVRRWRDGINNKGLSVAAPARIVGEPAANLYRWEADPKVHSRRPKTVRTNKRMPELKRAIKEFRDERPTWGKLKIHARLLEDGFEVSVSTVGRIISDFIK